MKRYFDKSNSNFNRPQSNYTNNNNNNSGNNLSVSKRVKLDGYEKIISGRSSLRDFSTPKINSSNNFGTNKFNPRSNHGYNFNHRDANKSCMSNQSSSSSLSSPGATSSLAYKELSDDIWKNFLVTAQSQEWYQKKRELKDALDYIFRDIFKYIGIYIVGSSSNGFGTNESDVDICLMISREEINQKTEAIHFLKLLSKSLRKTEFIRNLYLISAKVPIIKFHDTVNNIDCDLNVNNHVGIRNTHLLQCYSTLDWRATPLVLIIKKWAKYQEINDAAQQTISSYNLTLMAIYYMQAECNPPVLPVLQKLYPNIFSSNIDITKLYLNNFQPDWQSSNSQSLGELFIGFLRFYSDFDFSEYVISIRLGTLIPRSRLNPTDGLHSQWKYLLIEEPFELINAARSVYNGAVFDKIIQVFKSSYSILQKTRSLDSVLTEKFYEQDYYTSYSPNNYYNNNNNNHYHNNNNNNRNKNYNNRNNNFNNNNNNNNNNSNNFNKLTFRSYNYDFGENRDRY